MCFQATFLEQTPRVELSVTTMRYVDLWGIFTLM